MSSLPHPNYLPPTFHPYATHVIVDTKILHVLLRGGLLRACSGTLDDICRKIRGEKTLSRRLMTDFRAGHRGLAAAWTMVRMLEVEWMIEQWWDQGT